MHNLEGNEILENKTRRIVKRYAAQKPRRNIWIMGNFSFYRITSRA